IVAEEIGNAAHKAYQDGQVFKLDVLEKATQLTADYDMHDQIRAKLYLGIGRTFLQLDRGSEAVAFLKMAIAKNEN
ncbi:TPA: terminase, partial [Acinetobacter baumannii]